MIPISELNFGFSDAENYKRKENKNFFNNIFLRTNSLDQLCKNQIHFLIGEKGTGKTAYAVYLSNNSYNNNLASIRYIRETEYQKFLTLKKERHLVLSDYTNIWKVIIYLLISQQLDKKGKNKLSKFAKFRNLKKAIDEYYANAFSPEIIYAIRFVEESKLAAELIAHYAKLGGEQNSQITFTESRFQTNLLFIQKNFEDAFSSLKLKHNHILFIDGIDIRPKSIPYEEYLECVKGLANAVWSINNDFFSSIRDSKGRLRVVLLIRPDIFDSLGLQNQNNKVRDNSVLLDWRTTYPEYRNSTIFAMADTLLKSQQDIDMNHGDAWDYYFPYDAKNVKSELKYTSSFIDFLRFSFSRPRDIVTMLSILQENCINLSKDNDSTFEFEDFIDPYFQRQFSIYLLGEVKDQLSFYYSSKDYELFLRFFQNLNGLYSFSYESYLFAYTSFIQFLTDNKIEVPVFFESSDKFLQFLYDLNVICYFEETKKGPLWRWCYQERSPSNISPKVRTHVNYLVHYGMRRALNLVGTSFYK